MTVKELTNALAKHRGDEEVEIADGIVYVHGESVDPAKGQNCATCKPAVAE